MKLNGEIKQVTCHERHVTVEMKIQRMHKPRKPDLIDCDGDNEKLGKAMEIYEKKLKEYNEQIKAIESLGIRKATLEFGVDEQ